jgi:hypothetical protein
LTAALIPPAPRPIRVCLCAQSKAGRETLVAIMMMVCAFRDEGQIKYVELKPRDPSAPEPWVYAGLEIDLPAEPVAPPTDGSKEKSASTTEEKRSAPSINPKALRKALAKELEKELDDALELTVPVRIPAAAPAPQPARPASSPNAPAPPGRKLWAPFQPSAATTSASSSTAAAPSSAPAPSAASSSSSSAPDASASSAAPQPKPKYRDAFHAAPRPSDDDEGDSWKDAWKKNIWRLADACVVAQCGRDFQPMLKDITGHGTSWDGPIPLRVRREFYRRAREYIDDRRQLMIRNGQEHRLEPFPELLPEPALE